MHPGQVASLSHGWQRHTQSIHADTHTYGQFRFTGHPNRVSSDCGRKQYPYRTHAGTGRTCQLHAERPVGLNPEPTTTSTLFFPYVNWLTFYHLSTWCMIYYLCIVLIKLYTLWESSDYLWSRALFQPPKTNVSEVHSCFFLETLSSFFLFVFCYQHHFEH